MSLDLKVQYEFKCFGFFVCFGFFFVLFCCEVFACLFCFLAIKQMLQLFISVCMVQVVF